MNYSNNKNKGTSLLSNDSLTKNQYIKQHVGRTVFLEHKSGGGIYETSGRLIKVGADFLAVKLISTPLSVTIIPLENLIKLTVVFEEK